MALHRALGGLLDAAVDRRHDLGARNRLGVLDQADRASEGVDLDSLPPVGSPQILIEQPFEPALADHVAAPVAALPELLLVGLANVPEQVRGKPAGRVHALRLHLDDHPGQLELPLLHFRDLLERESAADADRHERVAEHPPERVVKLRIRDLEQDRHAAEDPRAIVDLARDQREGEGGTVVDEREAVAIKQHPPRRRHRADADAVLVGELLEPCPFEHLQVPELADDDEERGEDADRHAEHALLARIPPHGNGRAAQRHGMPPRRRSAVVSVSTTTAPRKPL